MIALDARHEVPIVTQMVIRRLDPDIKERLRARAVRHGRSLEAEAREILRAAALADDGATPAGLGSRIAARFAGLGLDQDIVEHQGQAARPADF